RSEVSAPDASRVQICCRLLGIDPRCTGDDEGLCHTPSLRHIGPLEEALPRVNHSCLPVVDVGRGHHPLQACLVPHHASAPSFHPDYCQVSAVTFCLIPHHRQLAVRHPMPQRQPVAVDADCILHG